jgi:ribosomal protein L11 methyltransferase
MQYCEVSITTSTQGAEAVCAALFDLGIGGLSIEDPADLQELMARPDSWDYIDENLLNKDQESVIIRAYLPENEQGRETLIALRQSISRLRDRDYGLDFGALEIAVRTLSNSDWENEWKKHYRPFPVGEKLYIAPQWIDVEPPPERVNLRLDPGLAFGTGMHHSTQLCLRLLELTVKEGGSLLDIGCGSGILSIAALLLGADRAVGVDIDQVAARVAAENGALNNLHPPKLQFLTANILQNPDLCRQLGQFDILVANIVADVIISLAPMVLNLIKPNGYLIASGIIEERLPDVLSALDAVGLAVIREKSEQGWVAILAQISESTLPGN